MLSLYNLLLRSDVKSLGDKHIVKIASSEEEAKDYAVMEFKNDYPKNNVTIISCIEEKIKEEKEVL